MTSRHRMQMRYLGGRPIEIIGPVTGTSYRFSGTSPLQLVDPRDAIQLARSSSLRVVRVVELNDESQQGANHG